MTPEAHEELIRAAASAASEEEAVKILIAGGMDDEIAEDIAAVMWTGEGDVIGGSADGN